MSDESTNTAHVAALAMLDAFASVGVERFDLTRTTRSEEKDYFRRGVAVAELRKAMPRMLDEATEQQLNVIVRPRGPRVTFIQLDDLKAPTVASVTPAVFLVLETSPGNFQAWVAIDGAEDDDFARRLRKGAGADRTASGATRVAGSLNFKDKYAPDFPRVSIHQANPGRKTTAAELERLGLVAEPEARPEFVTSPRPSTGSNRKWPSYAIALERAPANHEKSGPDTSSADIAWCMTAITWGWSIEEATRRLMEEPDSKASVRGLKYAEATARKAALFIDQRKQLPKRYRAAEHGRR
jgi:RepB DNA-primase from phage plasmid